MPRPEELSERDWQIIRHVHRYRVSTERVIWSLFFADVELDAVRKVVDRLITTGWLRKHKLVGQKKFLTLDTRGNYACGHEERARHRFSEQTLLDHFAVLFFRLRSGHERLTSADLEAMDPEFKCSASWVHAYYVRTMPHGLVLSCYLVDRGRSPRRLVTRTHSLLASHYRLPRFAKLIQDGHFGITILTAYPSMVGPLKDEIRDRHRGPSTIHIEVVPEMADFITSRR